MTAESFLRIFFALLPPAEIATEAGLLRYLSGCRRRPVEDHRLHITMLGFGLFLDRPDALVARAIGAVSGLSACRISLDTLIFGAKSVLLAPSERLLGFERLQRELAGRLALAGLRPISRSKPHMTLHYDCRSGGRHFIDALSWPASDLALIESAHGLHQHHLLGRWRLQTH